MKDDINTGTEKSLSEYFAFSTQRILTVDVEKYEQYLQGSNLDDDQKEEFLNAIWAFVSAFVELGFGVHPLQEVCGQDDQRPKQGPKVAFDQVRSEQLSQIEPKSRTGPHGRLEAE
ncbi:hypothetical protein [Sneathiella sp.]|uniref:hypothetical protein n=1 Tax=Sneathiella sp. TaxID=1964365 RepID=UPI00356387F4